MPWCEMNSFYKVNNNITGKKNVNQSDRKNFTYGSLTVQPFLAIAEDGVPSLILSRTNALSLTPPLTSVLSYTSRLTSDAALAHSH